jgi:hypothetical protein
MNRVQIGGSTLAYEVRGAGEPVVLVHGSHIADKPWWDRSIAVYWTACCRGPSRRPWPTPIRSCGARLGYPLSFYSLSRARCILCMAMARLS